MAPGGRGCGSPRPSGLAWQTRLGRSRARRMGQSLCPLARGPAEAEEKREGSGPEKVQGCSPETRRPGDWVESAAVLLMRTRESAGSAGAPSVPGSAASGGLASQTWVMTSVLKGTPFKRSVRPTLQQASPLGQGYHTASQPAGMVMGLESEHGWPSHEHSPHTPHPAPPAHGVRPP